MKKEYRIIWALIGIIIILLALFILVNIQLFDEEVTFKEINITAPAEVHTLQSKIV